MKLIVILLLTVVAHASELPQSFVKAIHQVESSGRLGHIVGDHGRALGPLQIHLDYWRDAGVPGKYQDCDNYKYAVKVMTAYLNKYGKEAIRHKDYQTLARLHNAGPAALKNNKISLDYWRRVWQNMR